ncbi:MAG: hypothetical protein M3198_10885, partial [Actinomycetota bacterium]|nr:hypothetical protein [Actinomycetota bacterium]
AAFSGLFGIVGFLVGLVITLFDQGGLVGPLLALFSFGALAVSGWTIRTHIAPALPGVFPSAARRRADQRPHAGAAT